MTARVTEKGAGLREIVGEKTEQGAKGQEGDQSDQVLAIPCGENGEMAGPDRAQPRAEAVHIVHEVESVDDGENPQNGDNVAE